jgi:hypothetical protein
MASKYKSYAFEDVTNRYPGYTNTIWIAPKSAFTLLQEPAGPFAALGDEVIVKTAHTFPAGEGFIKVYCAPHSVEGNGTAVGALGAKRFKWQLKIFIPGDSPLLQATVQLLLNDDVIAISKDANCPGGQLLQYGCSCTPGQSSAGAFQGSNSGDESGRKGYELTLDSYCRYFYNSTIAEKPAA